MPFDQSTRNLLQRTVSACRTHLDTEFAAQRRSVYGINDDGTVAPWETLSHLSDEDTQIAHLLRDRLDHLVAGLVSQGKKPAEAREESVKRLTREQAFTVLNRLAALRMAEEREIVLECVRKGADSEGFELFMQTAGSALGSKFESYRAYLFLLFDEVALDLGVLFNRWDPAGLLFPRQEALEAVLQELSGTGKANKNREFDPAQFAAIWSEDEAIGWIYQYYNDQAERKKMRDESSAPRNSRELAVRNQFFTPRYVVEFLTDNTLGRIWYEMTQGDTKLKEQCRYLVRRPNEFFLAAIEPCYRSIYGSDAQVPPDIFDRDGFAALYRGNFTPAAEGKSGFIAFAAGALSTKSVEDIIGERWEQHGNECLEDLTRAIGQGLPHPRKDSLPWVWAALSQYVANSQIGSPYARDTTRAFEDLFRSLLKQHLDSGAASQEDLLKQLVFIPHRPIKDPRTILMLDPACGSMHFGLYAFDLFEVIYEEAWEMEEKFGGEALSRPPGMKSLHATYAGKDAFVKDVPRLIIECNIHGIDIDPRAAQIAGLALWLRAQKSWQRSGLKPAERPAIKRSNIVCAEPMPGEKELLREFVEREFPAAEREVCLRLLEAIFDKMQLAGEAGSLLKIEEEIRSAIDDARDSWQKLASQPQELFTTTELNQISTAPELPGLEQAVSSLTTDPRHLTTDFWERIEERIYAALRDYAEQAENGGGFQRRLFAEDAARGFAFIDICKKRYDVALMNPPFGDASLPSRAYIEDTYGDTKGDVYKAFVECFHARLVPAGYLGIISSRTGFFLGQSEDWRTRVVLRLFRPIALADLGSGVLDAMVEVAAYVLRSLSAPEARDLTHSIVPVLGKVVRDSQDRFSLPKWQAARGGLKRHQAVAELEHLEAHGFVQRSSGDTVRYTPLWHSVKKVTAPPEPVYPPLVCVRALADDEKGESLATAVRNPSDTNVFVANPAHFAELPGRPFAYWMPNSLRQVFQSYGTFEADSRRVRQGGVTGNDAKYLRAWWEVAPKDAAPNDIQWVPYAKGGKFSPFFADIPVVVRWDFTRCTFFSFTGLPHRPSEKPSSADSYFSKGLTWPLRAHRFAPVPLPSNSVFSIRGYAILCDDEKELLPLLAVGNSSVFDFIFKLALGRFGFPEFVVGILQQLPLPAINDEFADSLALNAHRAWASRRELETVLTTSHAFQLPALLLTWGSTLAERATAWAARVRTSEETVAAIQAEIDDLAFRLYGLDAADRAALTSTLATEATGDAAAEAGEDEDPEAAPADAPALAADLLSYALGCVFGRWDIRYATGQRPAPPAPDPFAPLPVCPPGMLQNAAGLPAAPGDVPADYPLRINWPGLLVDDPAHPEDIERRVREILAVLFPSGSATAASADAIVEEACTLLGVKALREWFRKPAGFFADHLKRYSKSRRQAPIYWPLSTASGSYTLWLYYHRLTPDTLYKCLQDFVDPKMKDLEKEINHLRTILGTDEAGSKERKQLADSETLLNELRDMQAQLTHWAPRRKPNLNDGVLITACPLWKLFRLPKWQKALETCWKELEKGDYDWAHLALTLWPDRVREKCKSDRSLAIAHNLEDLCEIKAPEPKAKRAAKKAAPKKAKSVEQEEML